MQKSDPPGGTARRVKVRLYDEFRKYFVVSAYLFVCLAALQWYKAAVLADEGVRYLPLGVAAAKALILGKFLLIGEAAKVGERLAARSALRQIAYRVLLLLAFLIVLVAIEEAVVGWVHGRALATTVAEYGNRLPEVLASVLLLLLTLIPLVTVLEINRALGAGGLMRLLKAPPAEG